MWQRGENRQLSSNQKQKKLNLSTRQRGRSAITSNHQYQAFIHVVWAHIKFNMVWSHHLTFGWNDTISFVQARAVVVAGEARAKSLQAVAEALGGAQVSEN